MLGSKSDGGLVASAVQDVNEVHLIVVVVEENPVLAESETGARRLVSMFDGADAGQSGQPYADGRQFDHEIAPSGLSEALFDIDADVFGFLIE